MATIATHSDANGKGRAVAPADLAAGVYEVAGRQRVNAAWSTWSTPPLTVRVLAPIRRFEPAYWTIDLPLTASASVITTGADSLRLACTLRSEADVVGLRWQSEDLWSPRSLGYFTSRNFTGCILDFDFALAGLPPITDVAGLTLTVTDDEGAVYYVRLANYLTSGEGTAGHIHLDFTGAPVLGGFSIEDVTQRVIVPWHRITQMSIGFAPPGYTGAPEPLAAPVEVVFEMTGITVSGINTHLQRRSAAVDPHPLRMCDGYDDAYNLTPERIVRDVARLGYSGLYILYVGATHLHELTWNGDAGRFLVDPSAPVSAPARAWFSDLFERLVSAGFEPVISQSYEILADHCPDAWQQRDHTGAGARTGWTPPSTLVAPTSADGLAYIRDVGLWLCGVLAAAGGPVRWQCGEPWWWDGAISGGGPCLYDAETEALYVSETGQAVPTPRLTSATEPVGIHGPFIDWCAGKLGASTLWLRDAIKAEHPAAECMILIFTPQLLAPTSPLLERLNLPVAAWAYPAWDVLQLEDYDWVTAGQWDLHALTLAAGTDTLGYPRSAIHYFGGFNLLADTAAEVWPRIGAAISGAFSWGIAEVAVWARPQVWRDGWLWPALRLASPLAASPEAGPPNVVWSFPTDLQAVGSYMFNEAGERVPVDIRLSFLPGGAVAGRSVDVEILSADGLSVVRTITVVSPTLVSGRVVIDYPVRLSSVDFGFVPTFLAWRVRLDGGVATGKTGAVPLDNTVFVRKAYAFLGQSNALAHISTLSGAVLAETSAIAFRARVATRLGLSEVEVLPIAIAWGSSAVLRTADDDPITGVNYWWDMAAGAAGPRLAQAVAMIADLGVPLDGLIWAQGEQEASALNPVNAPRSATVAAYTAATQAVHSALRAAAGRPDLPIWLQTLGRGWWNDLPDTVEVGGTYFKAIRDAQADIAAAHPDTFIGTWAPGVEVLDGYVQETTNPGWIHYKASVYHAAALELADAVVDGIDRLPARPAWSLMEAPADILASRPFPDVAHILIAWSGPAGRSYKLLNLSVVDGQIINTAWITAAAEGPEWIWYEFMQLAAYGYPAASVYVTIAEVADGVLGPTATYIHTFTSANTLTLGADRLTLGTDALVMES